jgi:hypothetical protein
MSYSSLLSDCCCVCAGGGSIYMDVDSFLSITSSNFTHGISKLGAGIFQSGSITSRITFSDTYFNSNVAACCSPTGYGSDAVRSTSRQSCSDYESGTDTSCCRVGNYMHSSTCSKCEAPYVCEEPGITLETLPLPAGYWRQSLQHLETTKCWNAQACPGTRAYKSTDDLCAEGYKGPCK